MTRRLHFAALSLGPPSAECATAIDLNGISSHVSSGNTAQEEHQAAKVRWFSHAPSWLSLQQCVHILFETKVRHPGREYAPVQPLARPI